MSLKVFISYSRKDQVAADSIAAALSGIEQVEILIDRQSIRPGVKFRSAISAMISAADLVVAHITKSSLASTEVLAELTKAHESGKKIIALVSENANEESIPWFLRDTQNIKFSKDRFQAALTDLKASIAEHKEILNHYWKYIWFNLSERVSRPLFFAGIAAANLGFLPWYLISKFSGWNIFSEGSPLLTDGVNNFQGLLPAIWAISSNWSIIAAILLIILWRFKGLKAGLEKFPVIVIFFLLSSAIAASIFYNFFIDIFISDLPNRAKEIISTAFWSLFLSAVTVSPFLLLGNRLKNIFYRPFVWWAIFTAFIFALLTLLPYYVFFPESDMVRAFLTGVGLRTGIFVGLYFAAIKAPGVSKSPGKQ